MRKAKKPLKIEPVQGWFLICREEIPNKEDMDKVKFGDRWHIAWLEPFVTKTQAIGFAKRNDWYAPYRAVRGQIAINA